MGSPRKQSLLGEPERAPAARPGLRGRNVMESRIGLRRICFGELTLAVPPAMVAALGGAGGRRRTEKVRDL